VQLAAGLLGLLEDMAFLQVQAHVQAHQHHHEGQQEGMRQPQATMASAPRK
jgi:hypothetical protein